MEVVDVCGSGVCTEVGQSLIILHVNKPEEVVKTMKIKYGTMCKHVLKAVGSGAAGAAWAAPPIFFFRAAIEL